MGVAFAPKHQIMHIALLEKIRRAAFLRKKGRERCTGLKFSGISEGGPLICGIVYGTSLRNWCRKRGTG